VRKQCAAAMEMVIYGVFVNVGGFYAEQTRDRSMVRPTPPAPIVLHTQAQSNFLARTSCLEQKFSTHQNVPRDSLNRDRAAYTTHSVTLGLALALFWMAYILHK
jgi:hypothetical protein